MASSSTDGSFKQDEVDLVLISDCDDEDPGKSSTSSKDPKLGSSTNGSPRDPLGSHSDSDNFNKFLTMSKKHMRPGDENKIIAKLEKYHAKAAQSKNLEAFFESLCSRINKPVANINIYIILNEAIVFLKNNEEDGTSSEKSQDREFKKRVKKIEKRLEELDRKIKEIQAREVSMDDSEEETNFILENKLKAKFVKVYEYLCELTNSSSKDEVPKIRFDGTRYPELNKKIQRYLNKNPDEFPDYPTVLKIVSQSNEEDELRIVDVELIAKEAFAEIGKLLKKRRMEQNAETFGCYLTDDILNEDSSDPAKNDPALLERLEQNSVISKKREEEELEKYVREQRIKEENGELEPRVVEDDDGENETVDDEEETESEETEEDVVITEDKANYPRCNTIDSIGISCDSTDSNSLSLNGSSETSRPSSKRQRYASKEERLAPKISKYDPDEDVIVLSD